MGRLRALLVVDIDERPGDLALTVNDERHFFDSVTAEAEIMPINLLLEDPKIEPPSSLTAEDLRRDIEVLVYGFMNGYSGFRFLPRGRMDKARDDIQTLANEPIATPSDLCREIGRIFASIPDGHLNTQLRRRDCLSEVERGLVERGRVGVNVAPPFGKGMTKPWKVSRVRVNGLTIAVLSITKFPLFDDPSWSGYVEAIKSLKQTPKFIVVDLRGNGGGDDRRGYQLANFLHGGPVNVSGEVEHQPQHPAVFALFVNKMTWNMFRNRDLSESAKAAMREVRIEYKEQFDRALASPSAAEVTEDADAGFEPRANYGSAYGGKIFVLADAGCGSSCESALHALKTIPQVTVVGENTAGVTHFGNQGLLVLPSSRVFVSMSTKFREFKDGTFVEKVGYPPDVAVHPGRDALLKVGECVSSGCAAPP